MPEITPEQREAAEAVMAEVMAGLGWDGRAWRNEAGLALEALIAEGWGPRKQWGYAEHYPLDACVWKRTSTDEWVLEIEGGINETWLACRHPQPSRLLPEDVPGLPERYVDGDAEARGYRAGVEDAEKLIEPTERHDEGPDLHGSRTALRHLAGAIRALADKPKETPHG